jgi:hypothetical protein
MAVTTFRARLDPLRRLACVAVLAFATLALGACDDDDGPARPTGTFTLRTAGGQSLPYTLTESFPPFLSAGDIVTGGTLELEGDGDFEVSLVGETADGNDWVQGFSGRWEQQGDRILFEDGVLEARLDGNALRFDADQLGIPFVFRK